MVVIDKMVHGDSDAQEVGHVVRDHEAGIDPVILFCDVICVVTFSWQPYLIETPPTGLGCYTGCKFPTLLEYL